jgi:Protein of unknown function (DUF732)
MTALEPNCAATGPTGTVDLPPNAKQRFAAAVQSQDGIGLKDPQAADQEARQLCQNIAQHGNSAIDGEIRATEKQSPQLTPYEAALVISDAIRAYCPQFANR